MHSIEFWLSIYFLNLRNISISSLLNSSIPIPTTMHMHQQIDSVLHGGGGCSGGKRGWSARLIDEYIVWTSSTGHRCSVCTGSTVRWLVLIQRVEERASWLAAQRYSIVNELLLVSRCTSWGEI